MNFNRFLLCGLFVLATLMAKSQVDYKILKSRTGITCTRTDSTTVKQTMEFLDSIASQPIVDGEEEFLYDYGMVHYLSYTIWNDTTDLKRSMSLNEQCWIKYQNTSALWNLLFSYAHLSDCESYRHHLDMYLKVMREKNYEQYVDHSQIERLNMKCD